jgi:hypothetical protein
MMKRALFAGAIAAAALGFAGSAGAITAYPMPILPDSPYQRAVPVVPYHLDGTPTQETLDCAPLGIPPNGIGALPPANHICP